MQALAMQQAIRQANALLGKNTPMLDGVLQMHCLERIRQCWMAFCYACRYGEYYEEMREFHQQLPRLLRPGGVYSYFNGLASDNFFFHMVYGR
jgi:hypothetical protein